ncbi:LacI family DNA-binding transcriptional regulator [uncultured Ruegeria sp.]|uniref:LacI family DNA-binding transcriptional regulator n=1 Tax=uncultured Ruegeria sp. TaxID=259304 RepID=UPI002625BEF2|nr:LacI family DNA-binding transcriptional regulator [uncultured Ruegeria sp.]
MVQKPATIQDVARKANVSTATVSRVLTSPARVAPETRETVLGAIRATGYRVNLAARNLRMQRAGAVLVLIPDLRIPFYSGLLAGISEGFAGSEYAVLISDTNTNPLKTETLAGYFSDGRVDGAICLDGKITQTSLDLCTAQGADKHIVFLCEWAESTDFPVIASDNAEGARLAMRHLFELGHRRIAHVTGPEGNVLTTARRQGMMDERTSLGLPASSEHIIRGDFSLDSGHAAARRILAMAERPTAVFCSADMVAFGLIAGLEAGGLKVPHDISVVGFDDIEMAEFSIPALTTIRQDRNVLGRRSAEALLQRLANPNTPRTTEPLVPVELVIRDSTAPPPA